MLMLPAFVLSIASTPASAQDKAKLLDPNDSRLFFSFPIQSGGNAFHFKVELGKSGHVSGVSVFHEGGSTPFQVLPKCASIDLPDPATEDWEAYEVSKLLTHADLNFDGFEDLELLTYYIPHLDKKLYCIYLWDTKTGRFRYSNALSELAVNPAPHPENKTITMHEDWQGGLWTESTYRWNGARPELIEQNSLHGDGSLRGNEKCGFDFTCSRLVNEKMVTTLEKRVCSPMEDLPDCPAAASSQHQMLPKASPQR
jgi:hypothetical protein